MNEDDLARHDGTELLKLLTLCGWTIRASSGGTALSAVRNGMQVSVRARSLPEAIGSLFVRAMRSGTTTQRPEPVSPASNPARSNPDERPHHPNS
jgi:hypothetical protein